MKDLPQRFDALFDGLRRAYGYYLIDAHQSGVKQKGRGGYKYEPVTPELWAQHMSGKGGIGIVPIRDDATCSWGAIDIDAYTDLDLKKLVAKVEIAKMPLVVCRSKSGGAHVFMFTSEPVPASLMREKLKLLASWLGYGDAEIFPKQSEINAERKDIGNYLNMPYESGENTVRYGINPDSDEPFSAEQFLDFAESRKLTIEALSTLTVKPVKQRVDIQLFADGPPCLEVMHANGGFSEGGRNVSLFNAGIYFLRKMPDSWEATLIDYNQKNVDPRLPHEEVQQIIKSLKKKAGRSDDGGYSYTCKQCPLKDHCNSQLCKTRKFGITDEEADFPPITSLQRLNTQPPIYVATLEDGRTLDLEAADLQNQRSFQRKCIEQLNVMPKLMGSKSWESLIKGLLDAVTIIEIPEDASAGGILMFHLEQFCTEFGQARDWPNILEGLPFCDGEQHYFRMPDFMKYLQRQKFNDLDKSEIANIFRKKGVEHKQKIIMRDDKRHNVGLYYCRMFDSYTDPTADDNKKQESVL